MSTEYDGHIIKQRTAHADRVYLARVGLETIAAGYASECAGQLETHERLHGKQDVRIWFIGCKSFPLRREHWVQIERLELTRAKESEMSELWKEKPTG
jgi:hypothetical protein